MGVCLPARAEPPTPAKPAPGSVQVMFLPPPLEEGAVYSVGVYEAGTGRLVRRLHEDAEDGAFTAGLNGFITFWDRKDDAGKTVPAGRYAARGWAVGEMKVEGVDILGNDWAEEHEDLRIKRIEAICLAPLGNGLAMLATMADGSLELIRFSDDGDDVWWKQPISKTVELRASYVLHADNDGQLVYVILDQQTVGCYAWEGGDPVVTMLENARSMNILPGTSPERSRGRNGSSWQVDADGLTQRSASGEVLRRLPVPAGEPMPRSVATSPVIAFDKLYLLEEIYGWQRVRGLEWTETKQENGRSVSEWKTFFERSIRRPDPALGLDEKAPSPIIDFPLAKNPLEPGKPQSAKLRAGFDAHGSFLETADGLRLLPVSTRANLRAAHLKRDPTAPDRLLFYQFDGAAWDVFSVSGVSGALVGFDAGEFELTADGERRLPPPTDEPRGF